MQPEAGTASQEGRQDSSTRADEMVVTVLEDLASLETQRAAWQALADDAVEPNVFYEPWMLLPALRHLGADGKNLFVLVARANGGRFQELCGFFPLVRSRRFLRLPVGVLSLLGHRHCFLRTPLLRKEAARAALAAFFAWAARDPRGAGIIDFSKVCGDGAFFHALVDYLHENARLPFVHECHTRALFRPDQDAETYLRKAISGGHRRKLARSERQFRASGAVQSAQLESAEVLEEWLESFLRLEGGGWKGRIGTALACNEADRRFFLETARAAFSLGRLALFALRHDGRPVAMECCFRSGPGCFSFKPAFDEAFARFSPGTLMYLEATRRFHQMPNLQWTDSCTAPDNLLLNRLWVHRRTIMSFFLSSGRYSGDLLLAARPFLQSLNPKRLFAMLRGR
ncbi:MAG: GNAT family N-acetyltransferase [Gemmataceae bacterium]